MSSDIHMARRGRQRGGSSNARSQWRQMSQHLGDEPSEKKEEVVAVDATKPSGSDVISSAHLRPPTTNSVRARFAQIDWEGRAPEVVVTAQKVAPARILRADTHGMSVAERFSCVPWEGIEEAQPFSPIPQNIEELEDLAAERSRTLTVTKFFKNIAW